MNNLLPLMRKELVVIARRKRTFWMRVGALGMLSVLMIPLLIQLMFLSQRGANTGSAAEVMFQVFVWCQFGLLVLGAPAFSAGSISNERRSGTIELLQLAAVKAPTLTFAKLVGACSLPALLVLSEIPFLFIWTLFGGISPESILATLVLSGTITILLIAMALLTSALTRTSGIAMVVSYLIALGYLFAPMALPASWADGFIHVALFRQLNPASPLATYPWWESAAVASVASVLLSLLAGAFLGTPRSVQKILDHTRFGSREVRPSRQVWSQPVLWREIYCGGGQRVTTFLNVATAASVICFLVACFIKDDKARTILGGVTLVLPPVTGGVLGAIGVSLEKEGGSIASLLLVPSSATVVVLGKFGGAAARTLPLVVVSLLLGFVRLEPGWWLGSFTSSLVSLLFISTGVLFSTLFARSAIAVASTFASTIFYSFCCCNAFSILPTLLMSTPVHTGAEQISRLMILAITCLVYAMAIVTVLAVAVGLFESRARDAA